ESAINALSGLISVDVVATVAGQGTSESGVLAAADVATLGPGRNMLAYTLNGQGPFEIQLAPPPGGAFATVVLPAIAQDIQQKIGPGVVAPPVINNGNSMKFTSADNSA